MAEVQAQENDRMRDMRETYRFIVPDMQDLKVALRKVIRKCEYS
jgi:hypothetical protein